MCLFQIIIVPPGASIGYHEHHGEFEAYYVLSGEATISDNGEEKVLRAGDMNLCLDGSGHGTENRGSEDLVIIALIMKPLAE